MHGPGYDLVLERLFFGGQLGRAGVDTAFVVRPDPTGDHQAHAAPGALGEIRRHAFEAAGFLFQAGVHRTHQGAVAQRGEAQVQRGQQVRVMRGGHR